jgi:hypothetical protein
MKEHDVVELIEDYTAIEDTVTGTRTIELKKGTRGTIVLPVAENDLVYLIEFQNCRPSGSECVWIETKLLRKV